METRPRLLITLGDVAGIGPEILARAWPSLLEYCQPIVIGDGLWIENGVGQAGLDLAVERIENLEDARIAPDTICWLPASDQDLRGIPVGTINAHAGRAAYDFLIKAIDLTLQGKAQGVVTLPLHKEGLHAAALNYPGHTEILAERTNTPHFGMMLYARGNLLPQGLGVVHVTLHMALKDVFSKITPQAVEEKNRLLDQGLTPLCGRRPNIGVAALNPHGSDGGLFGHEEERILAPAVEKAQCEGFQVTGPWPCDTLFVRAQRGEFDGIVAMYHDQGHIPLKLLSGLHAVNVTLGLPIIRTSVAHGTAYDIAGQGVAEGGSLIEAVKVAAGLAQSKAGLKRN